MTDQSVFDEMNNGSTNPQQSSSDVFADQLKQIKNEDGTTKYDSVEKALEGAANAQRYIAKLEEEKAALAVKAAEADRLASIEEKLERAMSGGLSAQGGQGGADQHSSALTEDKVLELLQKQQAESQAETLKKANKAKVSQALEEKYKDKVGDVLAAKASELGLSVQELATMAEQKPNVVLQLFNSASIPTPSLGSGGITPPRSTPPSGGIPSPEKNMLLGASSKDQADYMRQIKAHVYSKFDVQT